MQALRRWSVGKVLLAAAAWFLLSVLATVGWLFFPVRVFYDSSSSGGIGVESIHVMVNVVWLAIPVVPPVVLIVAWLVARRLKAA
jgi:hypothetical protein